MDDDRARLAALRRICGRAAILGGALFAGGVAAHPLRDGVTIRSLGWVYGAEHTVILLGLLLLVPAIVGLQLWQIERGSPMRAGAFLVALFGVVLWALLITFDGTWNPLLAQFRPDDVHTTIPPEAMIMVVVVGGNLAFFAGGVLLGRHLMRARDLPRLPGALIGVGAPLYIVGGLSMFALTPRSLWVTIIERAGAIPFGLGFILVGRLVLAHERRDTTRAPDPPRAG